MQHRFDTILSGLLGEIIPGQLISGQCGPAVLLAVSGGIDSMCMAELFRHSGTGVKFAVAHCNFSLRGEESDSDELLVSEWAQKAGVRIHKTRFDTEEYARDHGLSIEMAARELRYGWFAALCGEFGYMAVAVAHNANDNVETLFLNLLRGTGIKGLSGMDSVSGLPVSSGSDGMECPGSGRGKPVLLRPLLSFTRTQIEGYVFAHNVRYHNDRTNSGTEYKRNKLRNLVFPLFGQINPSFIRTVGREMEYFSQVEGIAEKYYQDNSTWLSRPEIDREKLLSQPYWEYLLYRTLEGYGFPPSVTASLTGLLKSGRTVPGKVFVADGYTLVTSSRYLIIREKAEDELAPSPSSRLRRSGTLPGSLSGAFADRGEILAVHGPGTYRFNGLSFSVRVLDRNEIKSLRTPPGVLMFDAGSMDFPFVCRKWERGDWLVPLGMKGRKKVSDLFTDLKYSLPEKEGAVMAVDGRNAGSIERRNHIAAVLGVRIDDSKKIDDSTGAVLVISLLQ